jgi:2-oxoglutarate dehydrogenase E1 component
MNLGLLEENYQRWQADPASVGSDWALFFEGFSLGQAPPPRAGGSSIASSPRADTGGISSVGLSQSEMQFRANVVRLLDAYRAQGHMAAWLDPLSTSGPEVPRLALSEFGFNEVDMESEVETMFYNQGRRTRLGDMVARLRKTYCDRIGFEFNHISDMDVRTWLMERVESRVDLPNTSTEVRENVLAWLAEAEVFEQFLHTKYKGQKRFSLEGGESAMVMLNTVLQDCPGHGISEIAMGMAHRGRLTILANFLKKPLKVILHEFSENYIPDLVAGDGDVKYHLGYEVTRKLPQGDVKVMLAPNPSHLEAVNAVVEGCARAKQRALEDGRDRKGILPLLIHGDAAFAGQGTVAEVLNLSQLQGYRTGGTVHLVINNQIGFTTSPADARSSAYATDVAKMIEAPIFHVNGEHPLEVYFVSRLALEFRQRFGRDVVIDMYCYRRHGHNETDEPSFTQPKVSKLIAAKPTVAMIFRERLVKSGELSAARADDIVGKIKARHEEEHAALLEIEKTLKGSDMKKAVFAGSSAVFQGDYSHAPVKTGLEAAKFRALGVKITEVPPDFHLHATVKRTVVDKRRSAAESGTGFDWANAEHLAFGSLLIEGNPVRLSGQDVRRGTFSQRHACFYDTENRQRHMPLQHLSPDQATFRVYNSLLSEAAVLGFDYGYSLMARDMLVLWEAQFGDFSNGAQVIIDQFIASAESKWQKPSGLVLLLPHGYEGQGPEHSSARLERFLQLCADSNMIVGNLTTPAQYFHALRRQLRRDIRKPLILMTPKSMLRNPDAVSAEADFTGDTCFREMLNDPSPLTAPERVTRLIFCSGKVYYDLQAYRTAQELKNTAIIRIEQLYPFNDEMFQAIVARYPQAQKKWVWCQEEPLNMGAWSYIVHRLETYTENRVRFAGRKRSASPAVGSSTLHKAEQQQLVAQAFEV